MTPINKYFILKTVFGTCLCLSETNTLIHKNQSLDPIVFRELTPGIFVGFPICDKTMVIELDKGIKRQAKVFICTIGKVEDRFSVRDALSGLFMSALPEGDIIVNRTNVYDWEKFYEEKAGARRDLDLSEFSPAALEVILSTGLPYQKKEAARLLSTELLEDSNYQYLLDNIWGEAVKELEIWKSDRSKRSAYVENSQLEDNRYDYLDIAGVDGAIYTYGQQIQVLRREEIEPSRKSCAVVTVRNAGICLIDWLAYHKQMGIEHFFVYSNDNSDESDKLLEELDKIGTITHIKSSGSNSRSPQYKAYGHAFQILPDVLDFKWAFVFDVDEFLVFDDDRHASFDEFLAKIEGIGANTASIAWKIIGPSQQQHWSQEPVFSKFTKAWVSDKQLVKSVSKPRYMTHSQAHYPHLSLHTERIRAGGSGGILGEINSSGDELTSPKNNIDVGAWVYHYWYKSAEEFVDHRTTFLDAGAESFSNLMISENLALRFVEDWSKGETVPQHVIDRMIFTFRQNADQIRNDPVISESEKLCIETFLAQAARKVKFNVNEGGHWAAILGGFASRI